MESKGVKILIADDDPFVREMLAAILEGCGYAALTAEDGSDALAVLAVTPDIGLIISDMNMPGMSGLDLIKDLRKRDVQTPIIILTGNNEISVAIEAMNSGANDYLLKDENIQDTVVLSTEKALEKYNLKLQNQKLMADLERENLRLEQEKTLAQKVQKNILPRNLKFPGIDVGTFYRPSDKIGGDFFDAWQSEGNVHFLIGDVSGHSTSSALIMAVAKGMLQSLGNTIKKPSEVVATANRMLCEILSDSGMFLSLVYGVLDLGNSSLRVVSAGHNTVFMSSNGAVTPINSMGPVIGWDADDVWEAGDFDFAPGAMLFLYTDGLTEAKNALGEDYGEERLIKAISSSSGSGLIDVIYREVSEHCSSEFPDDLTIFNLTRTVD